MTSSYDVQICMVSDQPDPNLFSIFDEQYRPKTVYLLTTQKMKEKARWLEDAIPADIKVITKDIQDENDVNDVQQTFLEVLTELDGSKVLVNITGGTKLMAITASRTCDDLGTDYVYVSLDRNGFFFFPNTEDATSSGSGQGKISFSAVNDDKLSIATYLKAHGIKLKEGTEGSIVFWNKPTKEQSDFIQFLCTYKGKLIYTGALSKLNYLISKDKNNENLERPFSPDQESDELFQQLLDKLVKLKWMQCSKNTLKFADSQKIDFVSGRWLEQYVGNMVMSLGLPIRPFNLDFRYEEANISNELDVVFLYKGILHAIEVKTGNLKQKDENEKDPNSIQNIIHKLTAVADLVGGSACKKAIVSFQEPDKQFKERAKKYEIKLIYGSALCRESTLQDRLKQWIKETPRK